MTSFAQLNLDSDLVEALRRTQIVDPSPIQEATIPMLLEGRDVVGQARTGSGKTLAFSLPVLSRCDPNLAAAQALILVPTRELVSQVSRVIDDLAPRRNLRAAQIYGGRDMSAQIDLLNTGPQIIIGTPGRILDHLYRGSLSLRHLRMVILDEADQMLDEGFAPDVERILDCCPRELQVALFSATMPAWVHNVISYRLHDPAIISVEETQTGPVSSVEHTVVEVAQSQKLEALQMLLNQRGNGTVIIFVRTKIGVERLERQLIGLGYRVAALQGNLNQPQRERVLRGFRRGNPPVLVATNVAARGLDILSIELVINFDVPESAELLTHRLGRTGRMGRSGDAITLLGPAETRKWRVIERELGARIRRQRLSANGLEDVPEAAPKAPEREKQPATGQRTAPRSRPQRTKHAVTCADCGRETTVNFLPKPDRPVYCGDCYRARKDNTAA